MAIPLKGKGGRLFICIFIPNKLPHAFDWFRLRCDVIVYLVGTNQNPGSITGTLEQLFKPLHIINTYSILINLKLAKLKKKK